MSFSFFGVKVIRFVEELGGKEEEVWLSNKGIECSQLWFLKRFGRHTHKKMQCHVTLTVLLGKSIRFTKMDCFPLVATAG